MTESISLLKEFKSIHPFVSNFVVFNSAFIPLLACIIGFVKWIRKIKVENRINYQFKEGTKTFEFLEEQKEELEFYKRTDVLLTRAQREIAIDFFKNNQLHIKWNAIVSAVHYMKFKSNDFDIIITRSDRMSDLGTKTLLYINLSMCILCIILSIASCILIDYKSALAFFYLAIPCAYGSSMFNRFRQPYLRAKMVYNTKNLNA